MKLAEKIIQDIYEGSKEEAIEKQFSKIVEQAEKNRDQKYTIEDKFDKIIEKAKKIGMTKIGGIGIEGFEFNDLYS